MCSSILWMLALIGPNSTTCGQTRAMKRPSDVPPVVDNVGRRPVSASIAPVSASLSEPTGVRKGSPPSVQAIS